MTEIRLTNTRTRRKEAFTPLDPSNVRMYVCGPTVYDRAHLGNARPVVVFDVMYRLLRHVYGADHVTYVRNFTDVDDKINARAAETGRPIREITDETIRWYHEDMDALGALRPSIKGKVTPEAEPRATDWIGAMIGMIADLIGKGHAYAAEGHVLFDVRSYPEYGKLSGRSLDDMIAGARVEVAPFKRDPMDFVLWKPSTGDLPGWDSPWGYGRPGWHIECSAMAHELLGDTFDIHAGGIDLQFPHHENEIAQSRCAHPDGQFARYWLHNEMVLVNGDKMSKSLGNFLTVRELLRLRLGRNDFMPRLVRHSEPMSAEARGRPLSRYAIRLALLMTHYRSKLDWNFDRAFEAERIYSRMRSSLLSSSFDYREYRKALPEDVVEILSDDLNTPEAINYLVELAGKVRRGAANPATLLASMEFLGLVEDASIKRMAVHRAVSGFVNAMESLEQLGIDPSSILSDERLSEGRNYRERLFRVIRKIDQESSYLNNEKPQTLALGWADASVTSKDLDLLRKAITEGDLVELLRERLDAKKAREFIRADSIRDRLLELGVEVIDTPTGSKWRLIK